MNDKFKSLTTDQMLDMWTKLMGPARIELVGDEYNEVKTLLEGKSPLEVSNNQHTETDVYKLGKTTYWMTYGVYDYPVIEKLL